MREVTRRGKEAELASVRRRRWTGGDSSGCAADTSLSAPSWGFLMQRFAIILVLLTMPLPLSGQRSMKGTRGTSQVHRVINFRELARREAQAPARRPERRVVPFMPTPPSNRAPRRTSTAQAPARTSALPLPPTPSVPSPAPAANFEALGDDNTALPPDTQGAVGPNHLMVALNNNVRIQNRTTGATIGSIVSLDSFWTSTGATGVFDPKLAYDHMAGRWIFCAVSDRSTANSSLLIATSETNDPTGFWDLYLVDADPTDTYWADYPSVGFNKDWIVVTYNAFQNSDDAFVQSDILAFKKADLYAGTAATYTFFPDTGASTLAPALTFDNSLATMYLVQNFIGNSTGVGSLEVETITGAVGSETYTFSTAFPSSDNAWEDSPPAGADFAPQNGTADKIQNGDSRLLKLVYRNGSLWATHTVFLPGDATATRSAVQWWQFATDGTVQQFGRVDDGTGAVFHAYPSLAVNSQDDVLIGYSTFSGSQFASANYSFRAGTDTASTLRSEVLLKAGEAAYYKTFGGADNRWGDYSNAVVDPVNDLDMWTIQEYAGSPLFDPPDPGRWGTWWGKIVVSPAAAVKRRGQVTSD